MVKIWTKAIHGFLFISHIWSNPSLRHMMTAVFCAKCHKHSSTQVVLQHVSGLCVLYSWQNVTWWRHQMETFSALLAICVGNSAVPGEFPTQRPVTRSFDVFFDMRLICAHYGVTVMSSMANNCVSNKTCWFMWDVIVHPVHNFRTKPPL